MALGVREAGDKTDLAQARELRRRAFTLLARAYDQCRRVVTFLRWSEGDADKITPAFAGPRSKRTKTPSATALLTPECGEPTPDGET